MRFLSFYFILFSLKM